MERYREILDTLSREQGFENYKSLKVWATNDVLEKVENLALRKYAEDCVKASLEKGNMVIFE